MASKKPAVKKPRITVKGLVLQILTKNPKATDESILKQVRAKIPTSSIDESHLPNYRSVFRGKPHNLPIPKKSTHTPKAKAPTTKPKAKAKAKPKTKAKANRGKKS